METKRRTFYSKYLDEKKSNLRMIEMLTKSVENLKNSMTSGKDMEYMENRIHQTKGSIESYKEHNATLEGKLDTVMSGQLDTEINEYYKKSNDERISKTERTLKKGAITSEQDADNKNVSKKYNDREYQEGRKYGNIDKEYARFFDVVSTLPDYIARNLKTMPNNKGYKFRNITFYGELPAERNGPIVIFEKKYDGMFITETHQDYEILYFKPKDGSNKRVMKKTNLVRNIGAPMTREVVVNNVK